jgi:dihydrofolate reductase
MGKLVISENVTLDLVIEDPTGEEDFAQGGWYNGIPAADQAGFASFFAAEAQAASALLLGRRSYEWFASRWLDRTGPWADRLTALPKYVVSSSLTSPKWANTTVIGLDEVPAVKERTAGDIVVNGSGRLVKTLFDRAWADSLRLLVFPYVLGTGQRLPTPSGLRLESHSTVGEGLLALTYAIQPSTPAANSSTARGSRNT